jgi:hypothetical protein
MHRLWIGGAKRYLGALAALPLVAIVAAWLGLRALPPYATQDFEQCVEQVEVKAPSNEARGALMTDCHVRFAGRRKPGGGGYSYYDFMQDRIFDIAGPNPTADERNQIDREYMVFLDSQRREAISAELAKRQNEQLRAEVENARQAVGPPMVLTPKIPSSAATRKPTDRSKYTHCEDDSLSCSWAKFSAAVKSAFASTSKTKPQSSTDTGPRSP